MSNERSSPEIFFEKVMSCRLCEQRVPPLPHSARPVIQWGPMAKILIAGQAPGNLAHKTGKPFNDPSGERLRDWLGVSEVEFYDPTNFCLLPMGFCFPGYDTKGGDLPPRKECADTHRSDAMKHLKHARLKILVGASSQKWHLGQSAKPTLTETVRHWQTYDDGIFPIPHPSWRNNSWLKKNPWFGNELLPQLRNRVRLLLSS